MTLKMLVGLTFSARKRGYASTGRTIPITLVKPIAITAEKHQGASLFGTTTLRWAQKFQRCGTEEN